MTVEIPSNKSGFADNDSIKGLLELMSAYQKSQVLFTFLELEIPELLKGETLSSARLARRLNIDPLAMERFLNAAASLGLLLKNSDGYTNSETTAKFLVKEKRFFLGGQIVRHRERSSMVWAKLTNQLRCWKYGETENQEETPDTDDQGAQAMIEQHNLALLHGFALAETFNFSKSRKILDIGGGTAATSIALCQSYPQLESSVFDLPENIEIAEKFIEKENLQNRISPIGGDFRKDELPSDFDTVLLANFMAVADADENRRLLKKLYESLPDGGVCILSGWLLDDSHLAPQISVLFCLEDVCWNAPDVERSEAVYAGWLKEAGFKNIESKIYLEPTKILYGVKTKWSGER